MRCKRSFYNLFKLALFSPSSLVHISLTAISALHNDIKLGQRFRHVMHIFLIFAFFPTSRCFCMCVNVCRYCIAKAIHIYAELDVGVGRMFENLFIFVFVPFRKFRSLNAIKQWEKHCIDRIHFPGRRNVFCEKQTRVCSHTAHLKRRRVL